MNIFPKRKQTMLIPRDFTLSSKAFSRIWNDEGSWKYLFLFSCHSVKTHCKICFRLFSRLTKPWVVCRSLPRISQCALPSSLHCSHTFSFIPSCMQCSFLPQGLCTCSLQSGITFPFHPNFHWSLRTQLRSICSLGSFLLWKCAHVCVICVRVDVCAAAGLGDSFSQHPYLSPSLHFWQLYFTFVLLLFYLCFPHQPLSSTRIGTMSESVHCCFPNAQTLPRTQERALIARGASFVKWMNEWMNETLLFSAF